MKIDRIRGMVLLLGLAAPGMVPADDDDWTATRESFICRSATEVRQIKTYVSKPRGESPAGAPGCRVDYVKDGATRVVWSSHSSRSYCDGKASQLAARLAARNFSCDALHPQRSDGDSTQAAPAR